MRLGVGKLDNQTMKNLAKFGKTTLSREIHSTYNQPHQFKTYEPQAKN